MIQKLNLNTPDDDLAETIEYEAERAHRWYDKYKRNIEEEYLALSNKAFGNMKNVATKPVEWVSPQTDNHWIVFEVGIPKKNKSTVEWFKIEMCYWETVGSIGAFSYLDILKDGELQRRTFLIFNSHFFLRYRKRMSLTHEGKDLLVQFFINNPYLSFEFYDDLGQFYRHKGQDCMNCILEDGVAYCKIHKGKEVVELATFMSHSEVCNSEKERLTDLYHSYNPELYKSKEQIKMQKLFVEQLNVVMKKYGFKTKLKKQSEEVTGMTYQKYLEIVEPLYAFSRMKHRLGETEWTRAAIKECEKAWAADVVKCGWQMQLKPYTDKYGVKLTTLAIEYLIDNGLWQTPIGNERLETKSDGHYDGLKAINDTVTYLIEQDPSLSDLLPENTDKKEAEEQVPTTEKMIDPNPVSCDQSQEQDEPITPNDIAMAIATDMATAMRQVKEKLDTLNKTIENNKELEELNKTKAEVERLTRQIEQKNLQIQTLKSDYQSAQDRYTSKSRDYDYLKRNYDEYYAKYNDEYTRSEALEKKVAELQKQVDEKPEPIPTKRIFTYTELHAVPLIGDTIIQSLDKFFFAKKGIVIDYNK